MEEQGVELDHAIINRCVVKHRPQLEEAFYRHKRPVWTSWRLDETSQDQIFESYCGARPQSRKTDDTADDGIQIV